MRFFSRKVFQGRALCTHILFFVLFASLLVACGDDSVNTPNEDLKDHELSSKREDSKSSSSSRSHRRSPVFTHQKRYWAGLKKCAGIVQRVSKVKEGE